MLVVACCCCTVSTLPPASPFRKSIPSPLVDYGPSSETETSCELRPAHFSCEVKYARGCAAAVAFLAGLDFFLSGWVGKKASKRHTGGHLFISTRARGIVLRYAPPSRRRLLHASTRSRALLATPLSVSNPNAQIAGIRIAHNLALWSHGTTHTVGCSVCVVLCTTECI